MEYKRADELEKMEYYKALADLGYNQMVGLDDPPDVDTLEIVVQAINECMASIDIDENMGRMDHLTPQEAYLYYLGKQKALTGLVVFLYHRLIKQRRQD